MERLFLLLAVAMIGAFYPGSSTSASIFMVKHQVNSKGVVREVVEPEKWVDFSEEQERACANPGKEIPLSSGDIVKRTERVDFFHYVQILKYSKVVVFNGKKCVGIGNTPSEKEKSSEIRGSEELSIHVILLLIAMFFMAISNMSLKARKNIVAAVAAFAAAVAAFAVAAAFAAALAAFAAVAAAAVAVAADEEIKVYKVAVVIFYILVFAAMIV